MTVAPDYVTYYHAAGEQPFRTLTSLPDRDAIAVMERLFHTLEGSVLFERFRDREGYLRERRESEAWARAAFAAKGGRPVDAHPISMVLGRSPFIERHAPGPAGTRRMIRIPLQDLEDGAVSFTFPDSMVSHWFWKDRPPEYFLPDLHGTVFTRSEILALVQARGMPEETWDVRLPAHLGAYIEAQVWDRARLETLSDGDEGPARPRWGSLAY